MGLLHLSRLPSVGPTQFALLVPTFSCACAYGWTHRSWCFEDLLLHPWLHWTLCSHFVALLDPLLRFLQRQWVPPHCRRHPGHRCYMLVLPCHMSQYQPICSMTRKSWQRPSWSRPSPWIVDTASPTPLPVAVQADLLRMVIIMSPSAIPHRTFISAAPACMV